MRKIIEKRPGIIFSRYKEIIREVFAWQAKLKKK